MDLNCFFEALEDLANRLFNHSDPYYNLQEVIEIIKKNVTPVHHIEGSVVVKKSMHGQEEE
jgi:hypothetical protein